MTAALGHCPECGGSWPKGPDYALRGCGWLQGLPYRVSPSNGDVELHDDHRGTDRFLRLEMKGPKERWPLQLGQVRYLRALARQPHWTVRILRGTTRHIDVYAVTSDGIADKPVASTHADALRRAVSVWFGGSLWREAEAALARTEPLAPEDPLAGHTHGFARVEGVWTCIGDQYAVGRAGQAATACGQKLPDFA